MKRILFALCVGVAALALVPAAPLAQQKPPAVKAGKGEKVCRVKMIPSGEVKTWVCSVWHEINYVKCGSVTFNCL
jgi:hypothetical protein